MPETKATKAQRETTSSTVPVEDKATDLAQDTEAAATKAQQADSTEILDEPAEVNPATTPGDNVPPGGTLTENPTNLPSAGTGAHCGICGQVCGPEGEHFDGNGDQVTTPHANVLVVADNWPEQIQADNIESAQRYNDRKAEKAQNKSTEKTK